MDKEVESTSSNLSRLSISDSAECLLLDDMREMLTKDWLGYLEDSKHGDQLERIRAGAPVAGELARLVHEVQEKMSGDKYFKMQTFIKEFKELPGVSTMEDTLLKLSLHLECCPPETNEAKYYRKRVIWLEQFCHITGTLVGQLDVILGFLRGHEPKEVLKKTKDLLASISNQSLEESTSSSSEVTAGKKSHGGYCTLF